MFSLFDDATRIYILCGAWSGDTEEQSGSVHVEEKGSNQDAEMGEDRHDSADISPLAGKVLVAEGK